MPDELKDDAEILFRQIHPSFWQDGQPSSQPFYPTPKDANMLSVDRSSLTTASESFELFTGEGHASVAVFGLSVGEFRTHELPCKSDPIEKSATSRPNPAHAVADYTAHTTNQQKNKGKRLKLNAVARGRLYPPDNAE